MKTQLICLLTLLLVSSCYTPKTYLVVQDVKVMEVIYRDSNKVDALFKPIGKEYLFSRDSIHQGQIFRTLRKKRGPSPKF